MTDSIIPSESTIFGNIWLSYMSEYARKIVIKLLKRLKYGRITIIDRGVNQVFGDLNSDCTLQAVVTVHHPHFYNYLVFGGSIGAGEAYIAGYWSANNLTKVIRIFIRNLSLLDRMDMGWSWLTAPAHKLVYLFDRNTRRGSRSNIAAHYDLGNDFYRLFLDETMTYSCGIFEHEMASLEEASLAKYDRVCRKLRLCPNDRVLEIGTGWGGFAIHAAKYYGCSITTTTISKAQYEMAKARVDEAGLSDSIILLQKDYRDLDGVYDKLVSIEMIEAVGSQYFNLFFQCCSERLKDDGMMLLQAITITDRHYEKQKHTVDYIKRYIFPGSLIPSVSVMCAAVAQATDLRLFHLEDITPHYAKTLRIWRQNFFANVNRVRSLGFSDAFLRMWEYYLCYCEGGFEERYIGDVQMLFTKPLCRREPILPVLER